MEKNIEISLLFDFYGQLLSQKQQQAVDLYYNDDLSLAEISEIMQITRQGVRDYIKRSEAQLFEFEEKLGLYKRFQTIDEYILRIKDKAVEIKKSDNKDDIHRLSDEIISIAEKINE